ncbi:hypothetical protein LAD12857_42640 [Lacrimispora amygdalina]|uniref:DUF3953 domain-containing protein n=1 Tax=Lacrimispora amygdalina TaxID=253257 RepID=A0A3E2N3U9_9FIRM|nr:hypothetical protein [Clostridium indicum]RFZ75645.1 hypothetical protein DS742_27890 [Clostridium indicum]
MNEKNAFFCSIMSSNKNRRGGDKIFTAIAFIVIGLFLMLMPYEKFLEIFPAAKSKKMIKVLGGFFLIFGFGYIVLTLIV